MSSYRYPDHGGAENWRPFIADLLAEYHRHPVQEIKQDPQEIAV